MRRARSVIVGLALAVSLAGPAAWAAEIAGKIQSVQRDQRKVVLADGTELWLMPGMSFDLVAPGKVVKIVYDEKDGKKWVRSIEATRAP